MKVLETPRLVIREFTHEDAPFIVELVNTPSWLRYIGDRKIKTAQDARRYLDNGPIRSYKDFGFGLNLVSLKEGNIPIGMCGLIKRDALPDVDIGFAFLPAFEHQGYGYESAAAVLDAGRLKGINRIVAITLPDNEGSVRLLKKTGMTFEKMIRLPGEEKDLMLFGINF
jgi:RimJ/RimL family protein N-acetyltransferase